MQNEDKARLIKIIDFLEEELSDLQNKFLNVDYILFQTDRDLRRNLERCIENIVNSSIDIAKIILINEDAAVPTTYREYFYNLYS